MSEKKKTKKQLSKTGLIIVIGLIIIALPFIVLGAILIQASLATGSPINGERFVNDLDPAITDTNIQDIKTAIMGESNVDDVDVVLKTATLRIYVDGADSLDAEGIKLLSKKAYDTVVGILPVSTYFSQNNDKQMYDLEIHVYNQNTDTENNFVYAICNRNSNMTSERIQLVSEPLDAELAEELRQDVQDRLNPTPKPENGDLEIAGGEDVETESKEE